MTTEHQFDRRTFLKLAGGAAVIAGGGFLAQRFDVFGQAAKRLDKMANPRKIEADFVRQIITRDPSVSRTIMWQSWSVQSAAAVEWREKDAQAVQRRRTRISRTTGARRCCMWRASRGFRRGGATSIGW